MGVCAGSRFKCHGTDRTLVKDFTVTTLNVRLECRHIRVHNIAMHAAAKRVEKSQFSRAQSSTECNGINMDFQQVGEINTYTLHRTALCCQCKQPSSESASTDICVSESKEKELPQFDSKNYWIKSAHIFMALEQNREGATEEYSTDCERNANLCRDFTKGSGLHKVCHSNSETATRTETAEEMVFTVCLAEI